MLRKRWLAFENSLGSCEWANLPNIHKFREAFNITITTKVNTILLQTFFISIHLSYSAHNHKDISHIHIFIFFVYICLWNAPIAISNIGRYTNYISAYETLNLIIKKKKNMRMHMRACMYSKTKLSKSSYPWSSVLPHVCTLVGTVTLRKNYIRKFNRH